MSIVAQRVPSDKIPCGGGDVRQQQRDLLCTDILVAITPTVEGLLSGRLDAEVTTYLGADQRAASGFPAQHQQSTAVPGLFQA